MQKVILLSTPELGDILWMVLALLRESTSPSFRFTTRIFDARMRLAFSPVPALLYKEVSCVNDILNELPVVLYVPAGNVSDLPAELVNADTVLMVPCRGRDTHH